MGRTNGEKEACCADCSIYNFEVEKARECMFLLQLFNEKHLDIYNFILHFVAKVQNLLK